MAIRRFGPILGAGVQVTEKQGDVRLAPGPLGVTVLVGEFEKGPVNDIQILAGKGDFDARNGSRLPDSDAPKAGQDFYKNGNGAGVLITHRVTAGNEKSSVLTLYNRQGTVNPVGGIFPAVTGRKAFGTVTAKNGGRWAGRRDFYHSDRAATGGIAPLFTSPTTLAIGFPFIENEWKGGTLKFGKITTKTYRIIGNNIGGDVFVEADQNMPADFAAGAGGPPVEERFSMTKANADHLDNLQALAVQVEDGTEKPTAEFALVLFEDGLQVKKWDNLSADPLKVNYWVNVINDDVSNRSVVVASLFSGDATVASARPANLYGVSDAVGLTTLDTQLVAPDVTLFSPGGATPTIVVDNVGTDCRSQVFTGTVGGGAMDIEWRTDRGDPSPTVFVGQPGFDGVTTLMGPEAIAVTVTNAGTPLSDGDVITINIITLEPDELKGGRLFPDVVTKPNLSFPILSNDRRGIVTVRAGLDLTDGGTITGGEEFLIQWQEELDRGSDSNVVTDIDFAEAFDVNDSAINKLFGKNLGLVKIASPGITSATVTKDGLGYAEARNYQYRVEIPANVLDEVDAIDHINVTIGRSDYGKTFFPSFGSVQDPDATVGAANIPLKEQSLIGMILGAEAGVARDFNGYHKAGAGIDVVLRDVVELPTGDPESGKALNEEILNPQGINVVKFREGNLILWGDRTISVDSEWKWAHQRELMSHYENILRENFDFIIFALNDTDTQERVRTSLRDFFFKEFNKGALFSESNQFDGDAFILKIDEENNTDATRADGDVNAEISLRLVDTVERLKITIGKQGIFDSVG